MKNKTLGILILILAGSLFFNIFAFWTVGSFSKKSESLKSDYSTVIQEQDDKLKKQASYIKNNTVKRFEEIEADKKIMMDILSGLFSYSPKTKEGRYQRIEPLMSPEVYELLVPAKEVTEAETHEHEGEEKHSHAYDLIDEEETVSIKNIRVYSENDGDYLVRYTLTYDFPKRESLTYDALTHMKMTDGILTHWQQTTIEFEE